MLSIFNIENIFSMGKQSIISHEIISGRNFLIKSNAKKENNKVFVSSMNPKIILIILFYI